MIDLNLFERKMALLLSRFGREMSDEVIAEYYRMLTARMTTEQFAQACDSVFFEDDFFPSPQRLLDKVKAKQSDLALVEWDRIVQDASRGSDFTDLSDVGIKALRSIGGLRTVGQADIRTQLPHLRRSFLEAHSSFVAIERSEQAMLGTVERQAVGALEGYE